MKTHIATASAGGAGEKAAQDLITQLERQLGAEQPKLVMLFASVAQPLEVLVPHLRRRFEGAVLLGSSTAGEFTEAGDTTHCAAAFALAGDYRVFAGVGLGLRANVEKATGDAIAQIPTSVEGYPYRTGLLLLDPLAGNGEEATLVTSMLLGPDVSLVGGAAADDMQMKATHVACNNRIASDAITIAMIFSKKPLGMGVSHGHEPLSGLMRVTKADGPTVHEIEGRPAWEVWKEASRASALRRGIAPETIPEAELFARYLNVFEAGLDNGSAEYKIRVPLSCGADGSMTFACGIPEGTMLCVMESKEANQIESARRAAARAKAQLGAGATPAGALVFDCSCRKSILGDNFKQAVRAMSDELGGAPLSGFETYGEVALNAGDMSGFHNTTTVVLAFPT
jgi:methyl-accepting chemotaxis protein